MPRRDLPQVVNQLRNTTLIFKLALKRNFSKNPAYWVEIYRAGTGNTVFYYTVKQWHFLRDGETVEGEVIGSKITSLDHAISKADDYCNKKVIEDQWKIDETYICRDTPEADRIQVWANIIAGTDITIPKPSPRTQRPETPAERFKNLQKVRRRKSEW